MTPKEAKDKLSDYLSSIKWGLGSYADLFGYLWIVLDLLSNETTFTIKDLEDWLYQIVFNNNGTEFANDVVDIIDRLDGFRRFVQERYSNDVQ